MISITKKQIERQDYVDNQIFELIQKLLLPPKKMDWDIEIIGAVRDVICKQVVDKQKVVSERQFYP